MYTSSYRYKSIILFGRKKSILSTMMNFLNVNRQNILFWGIYVYFVFTEKVMIRWPVKDRIFKPGGLVPSTGKDVNLF